MSSMATAFSTAQSPIPGRIAAPKPRTASDIFVEAGLAKNRPQVDAFLVFMAALLLAASASLLASSVPPLEAAADAAALGAR